MIRLRLSSTSTETGDRQIEIVEGELLSSAVNRVTSDIPADKKVFHALVNGHFIEQDLWAFTKLRTSDTVLIAPKLKGGDNQQSLNLIVAIAATAFLASFPPASLFLAANASAWASFAVNTLGYFVLGLAVNQLLPPPSADFGDLSGGSSDVASSQMFSVNSQSNRVNKLGFVPKVYGTHRFFPYLAANPYTEIEADPLTGELFQYFYCIYDFGFGPALVNNLQIGDTPIENFTDVTYNFVDPNRPLTSEGDWDDATQSTFSIYKGRVTTENVGVTINGNQEAGDPPTEYEIIRNCEPNPDGLSQEVNLTFVLPQGLTGFASNGLRSERTIDLEISFSKVGENDWKEWNNLDEVEEFYSAGGGNSFISFDNKRIELIEPAIGDGVYDKIGEDVFANLRFTYSLDGQQAFPNYGWKRQVGFKRGSTSIVAVSGNLTTGEYIYLNGETVGPISLVESHSPGYSRYHFPATPLKKDAALFNFQALGSGTPPLSGWTLQGVDVPEGLRNQCFKRVINEGRARITRNETGAVYATFKFTPKIKESIKVRVQRLRTFSDYTFQTQDSLTLSTLTTRFDASPISTDKRHVFLELRIKATNQLNGAIQNLSGVVTSVLDVWNGSAWVKEPSANPAWVWSDLLTGEVNKRAIPKARLHTPSLLEWANFCDAVPPTIPSWVYEAKRFQTNFILDYNTTLQQVLNQVSSAAQASLNLIDGKYGVLLDVRKTTPVQIFTPRNSSGFISSRNYVKQPHALSVKFVDPSANWEVREARVYDDGYDENNASDIEELTAFACTNFEQAYRYGRFILFSNKLRQETINITTDFEYLVCSRGDFVQITQDVMKVGGTPARVKSVSGTLVTIDDAISTGAFSYGYVFRASDGQIYTNTLDVVDSDTFDLNGSPLPQVGDLIIIGVVDSIVYDCIVKSIVPGPDLTATLTLVERADGIYDYESTDTIPVYSPQISPTSNTELTAPGEVVGLVVADNGYECDGGQYQYFIELTWGIPQGVAIDAYEIYVDFGRGFDLVDVTRSSVYRYIADQTRLGLLHSFKVLAVSANGLKLPLGEVGSVSATPLPKTARPLNVGGLSLDITNEVLQLSWPKVDQCDIQEYLIRYSPNVNDIWESSIPLLRVGAASNLASTQARVGVYHIKAVDFVNNESLSPASAITTIPSLANLNVIEETTDFPSLVGPKERVVTTTGALTLQEKVPGTPTTVQYWEDGYYYYENLLDLGDIFTVRLQSLIRAEGYTLDDLMSNWTTLDQVAALSNSQFADWDVESEYRTTSELNVMSNWDPLSDVDFLSINDRDIWTEWRKFIMGDAVGRIFQFRLKLISNKPNVTPRVFDGTIKADMPDRVAGFDNQTVPDTGLSLVYDPAFYGPGTSPNVQVTIENAQTGDYPEFVSKTLSGLTIRIKDKNDIAVSRVVDITAKGYGRKNPTVI